MDGKLVFTMQANGLNRVSRRWRRLKNPAESSDKNRIVGIEAFKSVSSKGLPEAP